MPDTFETFTAQARKVLTLAQDEAQRHGHTSIAPEHLLMGLVREGDGVAARVLQGLGVDLLVVRSAVQRSARRGDATAEGETGLTLNARKAIELAVNEARRLGHHEIGTEHLLLGVVREEEESEKGVMRRLQVNSGAVRERVLSSIGRPEWERERYLRMLLTMATGVLEKTTDLRVNAETRRIAEHLHTLLGHWLEQHPGADDE